MSSKKSVFLLMIALAIAGGACSKQAEPIDSRDAARFEKLRDALKATLGERYSVPVPAATAGQLQRGAELYPVLCASCHGGRGNGLGHNAGAIVGRPSDFTNPREARFLSEQARIQVIKKGVPGTAMAGWEEILPEKDIMALYLYIRSFIQE